MTFHSNWNNILIRFFFHRCNELLGIGLLENYTCTNSHEYINENTNLLYTFLFIIFKTINLKKYLNHHHISIQYRTKIFQYNFLKNHIFQTSQKHTSLLIAQLLHPKDILIKKTSIQNRFRYYLDLPLIRSGHRRRTGWRPTKG